MTRKKWTAQSGDSTELNQLRLKRKWQIAFRRYIMGETQSLAYATYFGLDVASLREWISIQFKPDMNWDNFSDAWQFDHLVPVSLFDFTQEADLRICWNFINIRPKALGDASDDLVGFELKEYFTRVFQTSENQMAANMLTRLSTQTDRDAGRQQRAITYLQEQKQHIFEIQQLDAAELTALNQGKALEDILAEKAFLKKFS